MDDVAVRGEREAVVRGAERGAGQRSSGLGDSDAPSSPFVLGEPPPLSPLLVREAAAGTRCRNHCGGSFMRRAEQHVRRPRARSRRPNPSFPSGTARPPPSPLAS